MIMAMPALMCREVPELIIAGLQLAETVLLMAAFHLVPVTGNLIMVILITGITAQGHRGALTGIPVILITAPRAHVQHRLPVMM